MSYYRGTGTPGTGTAASRPVRLDELAASGGSSLVGFIQSGTGAVATTVQAKLRETRIDATDFGGVADYSTINTSAVQKALDSLPSYGGTVFVKEGTKFSLAGLTFPARFNLDYRIDDDTSQSNLQVGARASGERVLFSSNSSYPADASGGVVNEQRFTAPYHPGHVVDVRKDITADSSYLGTGQTKASPVRASYNIQDEGLTRWRSVYQNYQTRSNFSGIYLQGYQTTITLNGVGTADWSSLPAVGTTITGATSGAKGHFKTSAAGSTTVYWFSGKFAVGETLTDDNETTVATVTSVTRTSTELQWLSQSLENGAFYVGDRPPMVGTEAFNIGGNVKIVPDRSGTAIKPKTVTKPTYKWGDDPEGGSPAELGFQYDPSVSSALRRISQVRTTSETWNGEVCPVGVMCTFTDAMTVNTNSTNVASITKPATGRYLVTFTNALARAGFIPMVSLEESTMQGWTVGTSLRATGSVEVRIRNAAAALADIPAGGFANLIILGGDI